MVCAELPAGVSYAKLVALQQRLRREVAAPVLPTSTPGSHLLDARVWKQVAHQAATHRQHVLANGKEIRSTCGRLARLAARAVEDRARREQLRKEREEKALYRALKENDEARYFQLIQEQKKDKLIQLMEQTGHVMQKIRSRLKEVTQGRVGAPTTEPAEEPASQPGPQDAAPGQTSFYAKYVQQREHYYSVAHSPHDRLMHQPETLRHGQLKDYQMDGLNWLAALYETRLNGILADEMGLGKTIQLIALFCHLAEAKGCRGPHLVLCPLSVLDNWCLELEKWAPHFEVLRYQGNKDQRSRAAARLLSSAPNVVVTQYEYVSRDRCVLSRVSWAYLVIDEGHRIKNQDCKLVRDLGQYASAHRLLLSGTPLQNNLQELWSLLHFLMPGVFGDGADFREWFSAPLRTAGERAELSEGEQLLVIHRLHQILQPFVLRREKSVVQTDLPAKTEQTVQCPMSAWQQRQYDQLTAVNPEAPPGAIQRRALANTVMQLRQACLHPFLLAEEFYDSLPRDEDGTLLPPAAALLIRASGKFLVLEPMLARLHSAEHKVLIFSQFTMVLEILGDMLRHLQYRFLQLDGRVKAEERPELIRQFNDPEAGIFVFLLSTRAGGTGLNLQSADTVIIFDSDWNPQQDLQAQARAHRIGQARPVAVFTLATDTPIERHMLASAGGKRATEAMVIGAGRFDPHSTSRDRAAALEPLFLRAREGARTHGHGCGLSSSELDTLLARPGDDVALWAALGGASRLPLTAEEIPVNLVEAPAVSPEADVEVEGERVQRSVRRRTVEYRLQDAACDKAVEWDCSVEEAMERLRARQAKAAARKASAPPSLQTEAPSSPSGPTPTTTTSAMAAAAPTACLAGPTTTASGAPLPPSPSATPAPGGLAVAPPGPSTGAEESRPKKRGRPRRQLWIPNAPMR